MHKQRKPKPSPKQYVVLRIEDGAPEPECIEGPTHRAKAFTLAREHKEREPRVRICVARIGWDAEVALSSHLEVEDWAVSAVPGAP